MRTFPVSNTEISFGGDSCAWGIRVLLALDVRALAKARGGISHCLFCFTNPERIDKYV